MSAVIKTGGKQYRVEVGQHIVVEKLDGNPGDLVTFEEVLSTGDGESIEIGTPTLSGVAVYGTVIEQKRSRKILVFRRKRRKNFRRLNGHRQYQSVVEITGIGGQAPKATAKKAKAAKAEPKVESQEAPQKAPENSNAGSLTDINGIGPVMAGKLAGASIATLTQMAEMNDDQKASIDEALNLKGRIDREEWIQQAKALV